MEFIKLPTSLSFSSTGILHPKPKRLTQLPLMDQPHKTMDAGYIPPTNISIMKSPREDVSDNQCLVVDREVLKTPLKIKVMEESESTKPSRTCNCKRSGCLKLYCDCFANKKYCKDCNCEKCLNTIDNYSGHNSAIQQISDRNSSAFKLKSQLSVNQQTLEKKNSSPKILKVRYL